MESTDIGWTSPCLVLEVQAINALTGTQKKWRPAHQQDNPVCSWSTEMTLEPFALNVKIVSSTMIHDCLKQHSEISMVNQFNSSAQSTPLTKKWLNQPTKIKLWMNTQELSKSFLLLQKEVMIQVIQQFSCSRSSLESAKGKLKITGYYQLVRHLIRCLTTNKRVNGTEHTNTQLRVKLIRLKRNRSLTDEEVQLHTVHHLIWISQWKSSTKEWKELTNPWKLQVTKLLRELPTFSWQSLQSFLTSSSSAALASSPVCGAVQERQEIKCRFSLSKWKTLATLCKCNEEQNCFKKP